MTDTPQPTTNANPGSPYAVEHGCLCAIKDNHGGAGCGISVLDGNPLFWINNACPLHGNPTPKPVVHLS